MKSLYLLLLTAITFSITPASGQKWVTMMQDPTTNFYSIQKEFNREWKEKEEEMFRERRNASGAIRSATKEEETEGGYAPYKRWEYFMEPRVYPSGGRLNPSVTWTNYQAWLAANTKKNTGDKIQGASNWTIIGPISQGCVGRINLVQYHPTNSNIIYAGAANGGLWTSQNGGSTWSTNTDQLGSLGVSDLEFDPVNNNIVYLATGDNDHADANSIGVLKSIDGGVTWNATGLTYTWPQGRTIGNVIINPANTSILLASTSAGIYRTTNAGTSWSQVISGNFDDVVFCPGDPNIVYASTYGGYYRSSNNGVTFATVSGSGLPSSSSLNRLKLAVTAADPTYVYIVAGSNSTSGLYGFYQSKDKGLTFTLKANTPNLLGSQSWYATAIGASPVNKGEIVVGGLVCYRSTDEGVTWTNIGNNIHVDYHAVRFSPNGATLMVGNDGGAYKTTNSGTNWTSLRPGLQIGQSYGVGLSAKNPKLLISGLQDNGTWDYDGTTWSNILGSDGMLAFIDWSNDKYMFGSAQNGDLNRSTDGGANFYSIIGTITESGSWVTPWIQDPNVASTIYAGMINLWKSPDRGTTWTKTSSFSSTANIHSIAVAPSNSNYIYVGKSSYLYRSIDGGGTWSTITGTLPVGSASITSIAVSYTNPNKVWVTFSGYSASNKVYQTTDGGATWTNCASSSLPNLPVDCSVYQNGTNDGVYIGMDIGVYYKDASMSSWTPFSTGFPNVTSTQLQVNYLTGKLVTSTFGRGMWESDLYSPGAFPPNALFTASASTICTPQAIHFTDQTGYNPTTWSWAFGDGGTSSTQNPIHTYTANGTYTVKLVVSNSNGSDSTTTSVVINIPASPSVIPASRCGNGTLDLGAGAASGGTLYWYDSLVAVTPIDSGTSFTTPVIDTTTTYYVDEVVKYPVQKMLPADNTFGTGGNFNLNSDRRDYFDVFVPCTLQTVKVYASGTANRTIEVGDADGKVVHTKTVNIPNGTSVVTLNLALSPGFGYYIKVNGTVNLYRNDAGAKFSTYKIPGVISITGTDAGDTIHYYFFYDWNVQLAPCISNRIPVTATILFATPVITRSGDTLTSSTGTSYQWFLDGNAIPGGTNQSYFAKGDGNYTVLVTGNGCTIMSDPVHVIILGIAEAGNGGFVIYPNPAGDEFEISGLRFEVKATLDIYTILGEKIYSRQLQTSNLKPRAIVDISTFSKGIYFVRVTTDEGDWVKSVVKE